MSSVVEKGSGRHAVVTGGAGFIGSHLAERLISDGWRVSVIDNLDPYYSLSVKLANVDRVADHPNYTFHETDITDFDPLLAAIDESVDVIVHLAAKAGVRPSIQDPIGYQRVNVEGTQNVFEVARQRGVPRIVFSSSSSVYGTNPNVPWNEEDGVLQPISPYASTKVSGELLGHVYSHLFGIQVVALRYFTVYGPRQRPDLAMHRFAQRMTDGLPITMFGDGSTRRDYTFIDDIVDGTVAAMHYSGSPYEVINLGNNQTISLSEMIKTLADVMGIDPVIERIEEQPGDVRQTWASIEKAQRLLGYSPSRDLRHGLTAFRTWFEQEHVAND